MNSLIRNPDFDSPIKNTLATASSGRTLGATLFVNGQRWFVDLLETNPFGISPVVMTVPCASKTDASALFNDVQNDADAVFTRFNI